MAYVHEVSFKLPPRHMSELRIGGSLERVLAYLRSLLPESDGYISSSAMYSLDGAPAGGEVTLIFQSVWDTWDSVVSHRGSERSESKVLVEFGQHIRPEDLSVVVYREVD